MTLTQRLWSAPGICFVLSLRRRVWIPPRAADTAEMRTLVFIQGQRAGGGGGGGGQGAQVWENRRPFVSVHMCIGLAWRNITV